MAPVAKTFDSFLMLSFQVLKILLFDMDELSTIASSICLHCRTFEFFIPTVCVVGNRPKKQMLAFESEKTTIDPQRLTCGGNQRIGR